MVRLGQKVKDSITGFQGIATARTEYLNGCIRFLVESKSLNSKNEPVELWFDEQRLDGKSRADAGGPGPVAPRRDPARR